MKSQFLKIAGVKNDQEFYKLFPSEASFFKKYPEAKQYIETAQNGNIVDNNNNTIPDYLEYNDNQNFTNNFYKPINSIPQVNANFPVTNNVNSFKKQDLEGVDTSAGTLPVNKVAGKSSGMLDKMRGVSGIAESVGGVIQGFQMLEEGKKAKNEANQFNEYSKIALQASQTRPEELKRKYNRPEDNIISGDQLFPINGVGTNVLAKNGVQIAQKGKSVKPIYVDSKNDPRYKVYQDSLNLHKAYVMQDKLMGKGSEINKTKFGEPQFTLKQLKEYRKIDPKYNAGIDWQNEKEYRKEAKEDNRFVRPEDIKLLNYYKSLGFNDKNIMYHQSPDIASDKIRPIANYFDGTAMSPMYKKPKQPILLKQNVEINQNEYKYQGISPKPPIGKKDKYEYPDSYDGKREYVDTIRPREKIVPIENNIQVQGVKQMTPQEFKTDVNIRQVTPQPKYYNVTDKVNQKFGGSESNYRFYPQDGQTLRELSQEKYEDGTPYNSRNMTPVYENGGYIPIAQNGFFGTENSDFANYGQIGSQLYNGIAGSQNSGGAKIGGSVGKLAGTAIAGPVGGMVGEIGGTIIGDALDDTGRQTKKAQESAKRNMDNMFLQNAFRGSQQMNRSYMEDGGNLSQLEESGQLETMWGGNVEPISNNPYTGETLMFRGQSHNDTDSQGNSGIGINYGNNPVEVEKGEPATVLQNSKTGEENLVIFGNLKIPKFAHNILQDPKAHNKKFKNYVADLSKEETKLNKYIETSKTNIEALEGTTSFDKIELESNNIKLQGAMMKLKDIANKKQSLSEFQNIINDTAEEHGFKADDLARGKITRDTTKANELKEAMYGYEIPKAQNGNPYDLVLHKGNKNKNKGQFANRFTIEDWNTILTDKGFKGKGNKETMEFLMNDPNSKDLINAQHQKLYGKDTFIEKNPLFGAGWEAAGLKEQKAEIASAKTALYTIADTGVKDTPVIADKKEDNRPIIEYKKSPYIDAFNQVLPFLRPSNATELDGNQLLGEMYGMSNNQLEPVQSQNYRPELRTPYDISYQDQLNEITASERAAQRMSAYNPEAAAQIAAQSYQGKSRVLADQFRANQAMKEGVYSQNTQTLNDAQLKNLAINDTQYTRQEQAKSNTKAINQAILNSVSSKYSQNKLENRTLGIQENMYNYRFDKSGRAQNMNGIYQANVDQSNYNFDKNGKPTSVNLFTNGKFSGIRNLTDEEYNSLEPKENNNSELTPIQPSLSTPGINSISQISTISDMERQRIEEEKQSIANSSMKNGGYISNSALVKSLK